MKLISLTFVGYADDPNFTQGMESETIMLNSDFIISITKSLVPEGTRVKTSLTDRDIVVSETMSEISSKIGDS